MAIQIQLRRGTAAAWTSANPTLAAGELVIETDTDKYKIGDGSTAWTSLGYSSLPSGSATLASPTFTGVPAAPTASANTSTTQIATTAFVMTEVGDYAPLASPTLTGVPAAPTAAADTNTTQIATTAYVQTELGAVSSDSIKDADNDTKIQVEEGSDEDIIRFDTAGTERMTINADGTISFSQGLEDSNVVLASQVFR